MMHEYYVEKPNGDRINIKKEFPDIDPKEAANRLRLSVDYEQVIACKSLTVFRRRGVKTPIERAYKYGGTGKINAFFDNIKGSGKQTAWSVRL